MRNEQFVKDYFRRDNTVAGWWNPTEGDYSHVFHKEEDIVIDWFKNSEVNACVEVSCGKGRITKLLSHLCNEYIATDISPQMLSLAKNITSNAKFQLEDAENLSFADCSKDGVVCLEALVHYPNPKKALSEFHRILKSRGILIVDSDNKYSLRRIVKSFFGHQELGQDIFQPYSRKEFIGMLNSAGFEISDFRYVGVISPIRIHRENDFYILSKSLSERLQPLHLDCIPSINKLATYHLALARKI